MRKCILDVFAASEIPTVCKCVLQYSKSKQKYGYRRQERVVVNGGW